MTPVSLHLAYLLSQEKRKTVMVHVIGQFFDSIC